MPMWSICAQYCSIVKICKSINFISWNNTCQINDADPGVSTCQLIRSVGNSFVAASNFPQKLAGQCNGNSCNVNQACMAKGIGYYCVALPMHSPESYTQLRPRDCSDLPPGSESGVYAIYPTTEKFGVYCDMDTAGFGWTVFQRRINGTVDFYKRWCDYEIGFGNLKSEFWLGNRFINLLTSSGNYKLYVHLEDFEGNSKYALYSRFSVGDAATNYILRVTGYSGTAGDSLMKHHNGMKFTTIDRDNDFFGGRNCGQMRQGAWWYNKCSHSNLNGLYLGGVTNIYADGMVWKTWRNQYYSFKTTQMMIKRN
ncbi:Angiopoietin-related protein 1,Fibrinogen gamma-B chain,Ficolin-1-A,Angiopoietin-1,Fibrinogen C domain-containing protein 1,Ryncolin-1,Tenascin-N,Angiopoietin-related protein 7,Angiopoietin-related protein 6,Ficolin-3,Fibrinogen C domain-containing protein 1-B,Fibroleukin,Fibrinogen-like protein 1,Ficolin-1,Ficolin-1-B,Angiopoietin-4,Tenascin-R,Ryncolin-2,Techylectin-5B,Fibrinogen C domain-containing protein 1-A,Microfibril-associated glycoprotein 4,Fibrinogen-like protein A,Ryncolin-3,Fibrinogen gamma cha|uniref:Fibrinogen C-terminal domain-containing protein n=1 Tax=Mytilus edulis TaxID=6550 RepID=A0A8S3SB75_MYTED|nr:Angiopoietin-related protein 1,Fibrinogen gamma-B chain,Ficolin-1-A,Angiopoietin-1,Fibrinogen C domain-containing protein 1,Ryncolin-1,Tenascin-N,Angiopoietin-related protein 7,Angiopoietin-related protein 6,Ficolin-3,Fibrinogen C domain-containing protein 1-B,Fibroleukin,Fibrinogen-like protein 1,Ficolin-1,Ficolin-1-B,Angiopoietin-4,Tenascin-R,Ryncolin-2,Techylectin-5B,Fibrinogen C domain-containing protein 1-A,Microfibril-associated glycoprotein 4,Fibrinogen-like protein A,Ryncolin-3,Fibrinoge